MGASGDWKTSLTHGITNSEDQPVAIRVKHEVSKNVVLLIYAVFFALPRGFLG